MRIAVVAAVASLVLCSLSLAEEARAALRRPTNIPAQSLGSALRALAEERDIQVVYFSSNIDPIPSGGAQGELTVDEALEQLLSGTGLTYRYLGEKSITILPVAGPPTSSRTSLYPFRLAQASGEADGAASAQAAAAAAADSPIRIEEVVVTGSHIRGASSASQVITLDRAEIDQTGRATIPRLLETLPQVYGGGQNVGVRGAGAAHTDLLAASSPNLRGLGSGSTLTLVNGRRLALSGPAGGADISAVPLGGVERIEVLTDGASAIYGSDAVSGVVNVILKKDYSGYETRAHFGKSSYDDYAQWQVSQLLGTTWSSGSALLSYELNDTDHAASARRPFARAISTRENYLLPAVRRNGVFASLNQSLGERLTFMFEGLYSDRDTTYIRSDMSSTQFQDMVAEQYTGTATLEWNIDGEWVLRASYTRAQDDTSYRNVVDVYPGPVNLADRRETYFNRYDIGELQVTGPAFQLGDRSARLAVGAGVNDQDFAEIFHPVISGGNTVAGRRSEYAYAELFVPIFSDGNGRRLELTFAGRHEDFSDFGDAFNPKVGVLFAPSSELSLRASWGKSFRAPELFKVYGPTLGFAGPLDPPRDGKDVWMFVNGDGSALGPERATTWSLSADWTPERVPGLRLSVSPFLIDYRDRIDVPIHNIFAALADPEAFVPYVVLNPTDAQIAELTPEFGFNNTTGGPLTSSNVAFIVVLHPRNITRVKTRGVDLLARYAFTALGSQFVLSSNTTYLKQEQPPVVGQPMSEVSGQIFYPANLRSHAGISWARSLFFGSLFANYVDSLDVPGSATQSRVDSWLTFDLQLGVRPQFSGLASGLELSLSVQNLLNEDPPFLDANSTFPAGVGFDSTNASGLGRFISAQAVKRW